ncbi:MAG: hypothetical protein WBE13_10500 [Candidatus Acidiferrum sp.]
MNVKNTLLGMTCGALTFTCLSLATPKKIANAAALDVPTRGRFELVQLHPSSGTEWSGVMDTETGCVWVYSSQTPPTDAEVSAAPEGEQRAQKIYRQTLGSNFFAIVGYDDNGPPMNLPGMKTASTISGTEFSTLATEQYYCDQARQKALLAAASH